ncbi:MAG: S41 family peptidase [Bacteroidales bacterium]|jgi:Tol biopolymer transport system component/C-terminal processing protease CtpA/Prc|nr:S41 family peptidase [Bacteroidales bacterium]MCI2122350.1 S41 family peptidase [Bacteroidales bacterium]MCI2146088.1 S41 family peptidase [Bacteroidales bacterium]
MKKIFISLILCVLAISAFAQQEVRWLRYPAISPDGKTIVFGYMGNLYKVSSDGGTATPMTTGNDYATRPVWSHDGNIIAYSSDRDGNFDVFTMPAGGGVPVRLTYSSKNDTPLDFTPDNKYVLFASSRQVPAQSVRFPISLFQSLYTVPAEGGRPLLVTAAGADEAHYNPEGTEIVFQDRKGYEDEYRKHHTSSVTRDIWIYDIPSDRYTQVSDFKGEDRTPVFSADGKSIFYTNEKDGTLNIYERNIESGAETELTHYKDFPVREISISKGNMLAYVWKGDIYTLAEGKTPEKLDVKISSDAGYDKVTNLDINSLSEFETSPNGKEIAIVNRGEVFVIGVKDARTKRITDTPYQERMITWSKDGKYLYFCAEKDGSWGIYRASLKNPDEKYFYASTIVNIEPVITDTTDDFEPQCSPDNKKIAYVHERNELRVLNLDTHKIITVLPKGVNHSYSDGDWSFEWSPDSQWLLVDSRKGRMFQSNTALIKADGTGEIRYPVNSGFGDYNAKWAMGGKMMVYMSSRDGLRSPSSQGEEENDIYAVFFDQKAYDKFVMSKEDYELAKEKEEAEKSEKDSIDKAAAEKVHKKGKSKSKVKAKADTSKKSETLELDFNNIENRKVRLTINSGNLGGYAITKDGSKLYYMKHETKGWNLWTTDTRTHETKSLATLSSYSPVELSKDESTLILLNNGTPVTVNAASGEMKPVTINGRMELNRAAERGYIFDHIWRQVEKKFYDPTLHGIDWQMYHDEYKKFLPFINNNYDFRVLLSEMLGELNGSHTGARYYPRSRNGDHTASLGMLFDEKFQGPGIKVSAIIPGSVADKDEIKIKAGDIITHINGVEIKSDDNWYKYLNNIADVNTILTVQSGAKSFTQEIRPNSGYEDGELLYKRWEEMMAKMVDSLSNGKLGYVHIESMDESSYRDLIDKAMGKYIGKEGLVVDTRFNGGGWLHDDLNTFLSGKLYMKFAPQGDTLKGGESMMRWDKPSIVLISESNYSDAFMFPFAYKQNKIGKLVGMPVPGTGTAVWWESQIDHTLIFGIPMVASIGTDDKITENKQLEPDIKVPLPYNDFLNGKDPQLEAAVKELLNELK